MARERERMRIGRFSDGQEQLPESERDMRIGRFSDGQEHGVLVRSKRLGPVSQDHRAAA
jgi:hypothetical protein